MKVAKFIGLMISIILIGMGIYAFYSYKNISSEQISNHSLLRDDHEEREKKEVKLTTRTLQKFNIQTLTISKRNFQHRLTLPGQVTLNENEITHVVASVSGIVKEIYKSLGESTQPGDVLATLQSRDMAEAKSAYISAYKILDLKKDLYEREEKLWRQHVKAETQLIQTRNIYENAKVDLEQKKQKLLALGMSEEEIIQLPDQKIPLNIYAISSPIVGKIIERHITRGEVISSDKQIFVIANLNTVWIKLAVPAEALQKIKKDQEVELFLQQGERKRAKIMYVSPVIDEESRTGKAIVQLDNRNQEWYPGDFITAEIILNETTKTLSLPRAAIQMIEGKPFVFLKQEDDVFEPQPVQLKGSDKSEFVEVVSGLKEGNEIVLTNTFLLKAELGKSEAEHSH